MKKHNKQWSMYKGEEEIAFGTIKEIAAKLGVNEKTIYFYTTPTYKKRVKAGKNRREKIESE